MLNFNTKKNLFLENRLIYMSPETHKPTPDSGPQGEEVIPAQERNMIRAMAKKVEGRLRNLKGDAKATALADQLARTYDLSVDAENKHANVTIQLHIQGLRANLARGRNILSSAGAKAGPESSVEKNWSAKTGVDTVMQEQKREKQKEKQKDDNLTRAKTALSGIVTKRVKEELAISSSVENINPALLNKAIGEWCRGLDKKVQDQLKGQTININYDNKGKSYSISVTINDASNSNFSTTIKKLSEDQRLKTRPKEQDTNTSSTNPEENPNTAKTVPGSPTKGPGGGKSTEVREKDEGVTILSDMDHFKNSLGQITDMIKNGKDAVTGNELTLDTVGNHLSMAIRNTTEYYQKPGNYSFLVNGVPVGVKYEGGNTMTISNVENAAKALMGANKPEVKKEEGKKKETVREKDPKMAYFKMQLTENVNAVVKEGLSAQKPSFKSMQVEIERRIQNMPGGLPANLPREGLIHSVPINKDGRAIGAFHIYKTASGRLNVVLGGKETL